MQAWPACMYGMLCLQAGPLHTMMLHGLCGAVPAAGIALEQAACICHGAVQHCCLELLATHAISCAHLYHFPADGQLKFREIDVFSQQHQHLQQLCAAFSSITTITTFFGSLQGTLSAVSAHIQEAARCSLVDPSLALSRSGSCISLRLCVPAFGNLLHATHAFKVCWHSAFLHAGRKVSCAQEAAYQLSSRRWPHAWCVFV